jgi:hypothetical protein
MPSTRQPGEPKRPHWPLTKAAPGLLRGLADPAGRTFPLNARARFDQVESLPLPSPGGLTRGSMDRRVKPGDDESGWVNLIETCARLRHDSHCGHSEAIQSNGRALRSAGLLRRFASRNDGCAKPNKARTGPNPNPCQLLPIASDCRFEGFQREICLIPKDFLLPLILASGRLTSPPLA